MDRRRFLASAATAGVSLAAGCSGFLGDGGAPTMPEEIGGRYAGFQGGPRHTGAVDGTVGDGLGSVWSYGQESTAPGHDLATPAVGDGLVYVPEGTKKGGSATAHLTALDATSSNVEWQFSLPGTNVVDDAVLADGTVLQRFSGVLVAIDAASGEEQWRLDADLDTTPTVSDGRVFVAGRDIQGTTLYAIDVGSGETEWRREYELDGRARATQPAVADGIVYSVEWELVGLDAATGRPQWALPTDEAVGSAPTVTNDAIYLGTNDGTMSAFDRESRDLLWEQSIPTSGQGGGGAPPTSAAVVDDRVYTTCLWSLSALDAADGTVEWSETVDGNGAPVVAGETVYVAGIDALSSFATSDGSGEPAFTTDNESGTSATPAIVDGALFYPSDELYALAGSS